MVIGDRWKYFNFPSSTITEGYFIRRQRSKELSILSVAKNDYFVSPIHSEGYLPQGGIARMQDGKIAQLYELYKVNLCPDLVVKGESKFLPD